MGFLDCFKVKQYIEEINYLKGVNAKLQLTKDELRYLDTQKSLISIEREIKCREKSLNKLELNLTLLKSKIDVCNKLETLDKRIAYLSMPNNKDSLISLKKDIENLNKNICDFNLLVSSKKDDYFFFDDTLSDESSYGLYNKECSILYSERLSQLRSRQYSMIVAKKVVLFEGKKSLLSNLKKIKKTNDTIVKLTTKIYDKESKYIINKVMYNNLADSIDMLDRKARELNAVLRYMNMYINPDYIDLKIKELKVYYSYIHTLKDSKNFDLNLIEDTPEIFDLSLVEDDSVILD